MRQNCINIRPIKLRFIRQLKSPHDNLLTSSMTTSIRLNINIYKCMYTSIIILRGLHLPIDHHHFLCSLFYFLKGWQGTLLFCSLFFTVTSLMLSRDECLYFYAYHHTSNKYIVLGQ